MGSGLFKAYHWPGFESGEDYEERRLLAVMRDRAFAIQGVEAPPLEVPKAPHLLPIEDVSRISWQGAGGASADVVERSEKEDGPWRVVADDVSDASVPYEPLFHVAAAVVGGGDHYRVRARNVAGTSAPSNVVGPVAVPHATWIDTMRSRAIPYGARGDVTVATGDDRRFRERLHRRRAPNGSELVYRVSGAMLEVRIQAFAQGTDDPLVVLGSADGRTFGPLSVERESFAFGDEDYGYSLPTLSTAEGREDDRDVKVVFRPEAQLSRVEIDYRPRPDAPDGP